MTAVCTAIEDALNSFLGDPPDSDYQRGYLSGLLELWRRLELWRGSGLTPRDIAELDAMAAAR
jgi:hypothetical protein